MPIPASNPSTLNATYDHWGVASLQLIGDGNVGIGEPGPPAPVAIQALMIKYRIRPEDGMPERSPFPGDSRLVRVGDLYGLAAQDPAVEAAVMQLVGVIVGIAGQQEPL